MAPKNPMAVVKCHCGKVMRFKDWTEHAKGCHKGPASVTSADIDELLNNEKKEVKA